MKTATHVLQRRALIAGSTLFLAIAAATLLSGHFQTGAAPPVAVISADAAGVPIAALQAMFRRPAHEPPADQITAAQAALGARLFSDPRLSADGKTSCATCHDPARSFSDGRSTAISGQSKRHPRNSPSLWNVAAARVFFWDGRAASLAEQAQDAIEADMASTLAATVQRLTLDQTYVAQFTRAFGHDKPQHQVISSGNLLAAITAYERTLRSPGTRFDRWIEGDTSVLNDRELSGLRLFSGKARCLACHGGWRFTDDKFHDIGLHSKNPGSDDPGRQAIIGGAERAFKTPSLREVVWSAPYMHDGSLVSLSDVIDHYAGKLERRPSLASELKRGIALNANERADLLAFLKTISSASLPLENGNR